MDIAPQSLYWQWLSLCKSISKDSGFHVCQVGTSKINCAEVLQITTMSLGLKAVPLTRFAVYVCSFDSCAVVHCIDLVTFVL